MTSTLTRDVSSSWWTPRRTRLAGIAGIVGGVVLTIVAIVHNALGLEPGTPAGTISGLFHLVTYALMLAALLAVNARYGTDYGRLGRVVAYVIGVSVAALIPVGLLFEFVFGEDWALGGIVAGIAFLAMHLGGSVYGIVLWRRTKVTRLAAGLFVAVVPAIIIVAVLGGFGIVNLTPAAFEAPLYLGFAALGYDLWDNSRRTRSQAR